MKKFLAVLFDGLVLLVDKVKTHPSCYLKYKGYTGLAEWDDQCQRYNGRVLGISDIVTFKGSDINEVQQELEASIEDYLEFCVQLGEVDPRTEVDIF